MNTFSDRFGYTPRFEREFVVAGAPESLRARYLRPLLFELTYNDGEGQSKRPNEEPFGMRELQTLVCRTLGREVRDATSVYEVWDGLEACLFGLEWFEFYDAVEVIGAEIGRVEGGHRDDDGWIVKYGFEAYRRKLNDLLEDERIGWVLAEDGRLRRWIPEDLESRLNETEAELSGQFEAARCHLIKAKRFLWGRFADYENSVKESVSALESVCRVLYPAAATLGKAIDLMKRARDPDGEALYPAWILDAMVKLYAYRSSEPAVGHGSRNLPAVSPSEADLAFHIAVAFIRYVKAVHGCADQVAE